MRQKNRIALIIFTVVLTVSFLHPFCSMILYAEEEAPEVAAIVDEKEEEGAQQTEQVEQAETGQEEKTEPEAETGRQEENVSREETEPEEAGDGEEAWQQEENVSREETKPEEDEDREDAWQPEENEDRNEVQPQEETADAEEEAGLQLEEEAGVLAELQPVAARSIMTFSAASATGIDAEDPEAGQSDTIGYSGGEVQWSVPVSGYYDIYCYGAAGGSGAAHQRNPYGSSFYARDSAGSAGAMRGSRAFLSREMTLTLHVGGAGGNGKSDAYQGNEQAGSGGYSDGGRGSGRSTICDNEKMHNGSCASGGGGGSTYILLEGTKMISAAGGNGGYASYKCEDGSGYAGGGSGGGSNGLADVSEVVWLTEEVDEEQAGVNSGNGYIQFTLVKAMPSVRLKASPTDWTNGNTELTAIVKSVGSGLEESYLSWESAEDGSSIWTDLLTYTVDQNGSYTCKIRDIDGNTGTAEIRVDNIDKLKPSAEITSSQEWTTEPVTLTVSAEDRAATDEYGCSGLAEAAYLWGKNGERQEEVWGTDITYTAAASGSYFCKVRDRAGNIRKVDYYVGCIDVTAPSATMTADPARPTWKDVTLTITATDTGVGLAELPYCWEQDENGDDIWTAENTLVTDQNGLYHCKVRDALGNVTEVTCMVNNIDKSLKNKNDGHDSGGGSGNGTQNSEQNQVLPDEMPVDALALPDLELQEGQNSDGDEDDRETKAPGADRDSNRMDQLQELSGMEDGEPEIMEEELIKPIRPTMSPETVAGAAQHGTVQREKHWMDFLDDPDIRTIILYSVWLVVVLCGLAWLLFSLLFEHVTVYRADRNGKFRKAGRLVIIRKKDYRQINLTPLQEKNEDRKYKLRFSHGFAYLNRKEKILIRTYHGVELRNVGREIIV